MKVKKIANVRLDTNNSPFSKDWKVFLNGEDITRSVRSVAVTANIHSIATVTLELVASFSFPERSVLVEIVPSIICEHCRKIMMEVSEDARYCQSCFDLFYREQSAYMVSTPLTYE